MYEYYDSLKRDEKEKKCNWEFPDFSNCCPLCHGKGCAVRIGFYCRQKVIINKKTYRDFPISRWMCQKKGPIKSAHRTFSLLPYQLTPYHQHDLNTILETMQFKSNPGHSLKDTKDFVSVQGIGTDIPLENSQIHDFQSIFSQTFVKLIATPEIKQKIIDSKLFSSDNPVQTVIHFINRYQSPIASFCSSETSNIERLALDFFFHYQGGDYFKRDFLLGTPSQKR